MTSADGLFFWREEDILDDNKKRIAPATLREKFVDYPSIQSVIDIMDMQYRATGKSELRVNFIPLIMPNVKELGLGEVVVQNAGRLEIILSLEVFSDIAERLSILPLRSIFLIEKVCSQMLRRPAKNDKRA